MFNGLEFFHSTNGYSPILSSSAATTTAAAANESEQRHYHQQNSYHHHSIPPLAVARATSYQSMEPTTSSSSSSTTTAIATISSSSSSTLPNQYHAQHSTNHNQYVYTSALRYEQFTRQNTRASSLNAIGDSMSEIIVSIIFGPRFSGIQLIFFVLFICVLFFFLVGWE